ncbi:hypothetical protein C480_19349 [Natrialba aegyptia DSM 13077]|uniref:Uncharacterized protein n=1 Tax=Natrialba aegyptia DSM 13077 TaxID=1227491 RepID=M0ANN3_9EURY|nr:hypothetical protein C480_19349 [Natrialba aegyptia DSM 13077]
MRKSATSSGSDQNRVKTSTSGAATAKDPRTSTRVRNADPHRHIDVAVLDGITELRVFEQFYTLN